MDEVRNLLRYPLNTNRANDCYRKIKRKPVANLAKKIKQETSYWPFIMPWNKSSQHMSIFAYFNNQTGKKYISAVLRISYIRLCFSLY